MRVVLAGTCACSLRWPFDMPTQGAMTLLQLRLQSSGSPFSVRKQKMFDHQSIERNRDPIWRFCEEGQRGVSGFPLHCRIPPSSPPLLEMSGSDFRNVSVQGSISISSFDCTSALRALDFNFDTRTDRCQAEMQSNSRFRFQLLKRPLSHRNAIEPSISISTLDFRSE